MYFIFEIAFSSHKSYIKNLIKSYIGLFGIKAEVLQSAEKIYIIIDKEEPQIEQFLLGLETFLPASLYMGKSRHYFSDDKPDFQEIEEINLPLNISLCPNCQKELFDINSNRYYYPFTSCNNCGGQLPFLQNYPFERKNSSFKFLTPCSSCQKELKENPFRVGYPLISCLECGINLKIRDHKSTRYANDKGSYKQLFEVAAKAIYKGKTVLVKSLNGYRKFFIPKEGDEVERSITLFCNARALNSKLMLINQEFNALLSIERPILRVSTKSDDMKALFGSSTYVKYPDDAITMLLSKELVDLGLDFIAFIECNEDEDADYLVDFDLPIEVQKDIKLFINQDTKLFINGERVVFPLVVDNPKRVTAVANKLAAFTLDDKTVVDLLSRFKSIETKELRVLEGESVEIDIKAKKRSLFRQREASMISVLKEYDLLKEKALSIHFDSNLYFLYYNGFHVVDILKPIAFNGDDFWDKIKSLREGSDRLVLNFKERYPKLYEELEDIERNMDIFDIASKIMGLKTEGIEAISKEALNFYGKGGILIDTKIRDKRFDSYAFLASIISYKLAGVESSMLSYSIYESFGDYIGEIIPQLIRKFKCTTVVLSGESFANQALYARVQKNIGIYKPIMNKNIPIGRENGVVDALYL